MPYRIAGIDVHKTMVAVAVITVSSLLPTPTVMRCNRRLIQMHLRRK